MVIIYLAESQDTVTQIFQFLETLEQQPRNQISEISDNQFSQASQTLDHKQEQNRQMK